MLELRSGRLQPHSQTQDLPEKIVAMRKRPSLFSPPLAMMKSVMALISDKNFVSGLNSLKTYECNFRNKIES
jgi:hypothetical protein